MTFQEQTDQIRTSVHLLDALPVRILKQILGTKATNKKELVADLAFSLDFHGIQVTESVLNSDFLVFTFEGEKVGAIDTRRGKQEFQLISGDWSTGWDKFIAYLVVQKRGIQAVQAERQDESLDHLDTPLTEDERSFIWLHGTLADNILSQIGRTDRLALVRGDDGEFLVVDIESGNEPIIWTRPDMRLWGTSVYQWGQLTPFPLEHLTHYVNNIS